MSDGDDRGGDAFAVRRAEPADVVALAALATRFTANAWHGDPAVAERVTYLSPTRSPAALRRGLEESTVLVAVVEARLVGYAQFGPVRIGGVRAGAGDLSLQRLHVEASRQGRGIGRRLMETALADAAIAAAPRLFLRVSEHNARALALYERLGFRRAGPGTFTAGAAPGGDLVLVRGRA